MPILQFFHAEWHCWRIIDPNSRQKLTTPNGRFAFGFSFQSIDKQGFAMSETVFVVGIDGSDAGERALAFAKDRAKAVGSCTILLCYVIEWSPFSFQTPEENAMRHKRREEEISMALSRVLDPAVAATKADGFSVTGVVKHGDVAEILDDLAKEHGAAQIIVGRVGRRGLKERVFGGVTGRLVASASVPVTIIP